MPDQVKVGFVVAGAAGGIAAHVGSLVADLPSLDVNVTIMAPVDTLLAMRCDRATTTIVPAPVGAATPWAWWSVRRQLRRLATPGVVVHAHGLRAGLAAVAARRRSPIVVTWHNAPLGSPLHRLVHTAVERWVARRATVTLAASEDLAERARRAGARDVRVVLVGSPMPSAACSREQVRQGLGIEPDVPLVLAVARLHPQKRLDVLVDAAAPWPATGPAGRRVMIAGDGPLRDQLSAQIARDGAPVGLLGARDDIAELLVAADVVVLTSEWEARSLVAQEALLAGVPLVCTAAGGLPALVGDAAILVPVGDPSATRSAVDRVLGDGDLRATLVERGRKRAASWPTRRDIAGQLLTLYLDLRSRSDPRTR